MVVCTGIETEPGVRLDQSSGQTGKRGLSLGLYGSLLFSIGGASRPS